MSERFDALVIGAGAGGLCAAALLAKRGARTLVVERLDRLGGRASTEEIDGFLINNGAVGLELGGEMEALFEEVDAPYPVPQPEVPFAIHIKGRTLDASSPVIRRLVDDVILRAGAWITRRRWPGAERDPAGAESFAAWLSRYTRNETVHALFRNIAAGLLSVNTHELTARAMLTYFTQKGGFRRYGYVPGGTIAVWRSLAGAIERDGGEIWRSSEVSRLHVDEGTVGAATIDRDGKQVVVEADHVISNVGPRATIALCGSDAFPTEYVERVERDQRSAAMITFHLASREPLMGRAGLVFFADTKRLCALANLTSSAPDVAPPGWHLYVAGTVPDPAVGPFDAEAEIALAWEELVREVPRVAGARHLDTRVMRDEWPCQRVVIGHDLPRVTPVANLWNVGDAVRAYPNAGTQGCAESARLVVDAIGPMRLRRSTPRRADATVRSER